MTYLAESEDEIVLHHLPADGIEVRHRYVDGASVDPPFMWMERRHIWEHPVYAVST